MKKIPVKPAYRPVPVASVFPKVFCPNFEEESKLLKDCDCLNFIDASILKPSLQTFVDVNSDTIEAHPPVDLSGLSDDVLIETCENRYLDTNEVNEYLLNKYDEEYKSK